MDILLINFHPLPHTFIGWVYYLLCLSFSPALLAFMTKLDIIRRIMRFKLLHGLDFGIWEYGMV